MILKTMITISIMIRKIRMRVSSKNDGILVIIGITTIIMIRRRMIRRRWGTVIKTILSMYIYENIEDAQGMWDRILFFIP